MTTTALPKTELIAPPELALDQISPARRFLMRQDLEANQGANLWYELAHPDHPNLDHSTDLIISFDNLATIDEGWPRAPWAMHRLAPVGAAILGVQSHSKNWFRSPAAPLLLKSLAETGFFDQFRAIVMMGASMGGFAALNFAPLIARARVIAFSAQSTMNKDIAPFEARFPFAVRKSNWSEPAYLDAAKAIGQIPSAALLFDPFTPEDMQHAARMRGANVQYLPLPHATHEAVRVVMKAGAFQVLVQDMLTHGRIGQGFWSAYRARKSVPKWQKSMLARAAERGHWALAGQAAQRILQMAAQSGVAEEDLAFARRAKRMAQEQLSKPAAK